MCVCVLSPSLSDVLMMLCVCDRLQQTVDVLQQQLRDSHSLVQTLQSELQVRRRGGGVTTNTHSGK